MPNQPTVCVEAKPWWKSATLIFNVLAALVAILTEVSTAVNLPADTSRWIMLAIAVINVILRFRTVQPVTTSSTPASAEAPAPPVGR